MPAQSQQQQKLFGLALSVKRGETPRSEASDEVLNIVNSMSEKEIEDFASTPHSGLPSKVESQLRGVVREIMRERVLSEAAGKEAMGIAAFTGTRGDAVQKFIDDNKLDAKKLFNYVKGGKLTDRLNFVTAIVGTPGNSVQKKMIKMFGESVNELKKLPSGNFSIKVGYPTFADYEKKAKTGDTILRYDKRGGMIKAFVNGSELDKNAEKYLDKVNGIIGGVVFLTKKGMKGVAQVPDYEKKDIGVLVLESKSINESHFKVGDSVECIKSGMSGQVVGLDKAHGGQDEPYYTVKREDGKVMKYAPNALKLRESVNEEITVGKMVKVVDNPHWEAALGKKGPFKRKVKMIDGDNVFFTDGSNSSMKYVKESVESVNEESYNFGKEEYTKKGLTPTDIHSLAMAYIQTPITKLAGKSLGHRVYVANDLARLTGTTQMDITKRGKPALIVVLLKNGLLDKSEYAKLYRNLIKLQKDFIDKYLLNADPASRMVGGSAARQAYKDMKGEFDTE